jgi:hypothetical protein
VAQGYAEVAHRTAVMPVFFDAHVTDAFFEQPGISESTVRYGAHIDTLRRVRCAPTSVRSHVPVFADHVGLTR